MSCSPDVISCCLLGDIPASSFEVLLSRLWPQDHARLRQVSKTVWKRTTEHVSVISLRLNEHSTADQLQQWCQATKQLQHVRAIKVLISGTASAYVFDLAMQMLSEHISATVLHLKAVEDQCSSGSIDSISSSSTNAKAYLPSLSHVYHMLAQLDWLAIDGIRFDDLAKTLRWLAAGAEGGGGGWQLKKLDIKAVWRCDSCPIKGRPTEDLMVSWSVCAAALMHLATAFPELKSLAINLPAQLNFDTGQHFHATHAQSQSMNYADDAAAVALDPHVKEQLAKVAVVAAVANAAMQLKNLVTLAVWDIPDIWCSGSHSQSLRWFELDSSSDPASSAAETAAVTPPSLAAFADAVLSGGFLQSTSAAAKAFLTLDDCGCWLLQHHATLKDLKLHCTAERGSTTFNWQQQQQQHSQPGSSSNAPSHKASLPPNIAAIQLSADLSQSPQQPGRANVLSGDSNTASSSSSSIRNVGNSLISSIHQRLLPYSFRPRSYIFQQITEMRLTLFETDVDCLADLLGHLKSLEKLKVEPNCSDATMTYYHVVKAIVAAAAAVTGLQTLVIQADKGKHVLPDDVLLPLTAAAGEPGGSLTTLNLSGNFLVDVPDIVASDEISFLFGESLWRHLDSESPNSETEQQLADEKVADTTACSSNHSNGVPVDALEKAIPAIAAAAASSSNELIAASCKIVAEQHQGQQTGTTAADTSESAWHHALRQLPALRALTVRQYGKCQLHLPVESLPASLEVLAGSKLFLCENCTPVQQPAIDRYLQNDDSATVEGCDAQPSLACNDGSVETTDCNNSAALAAVTIDQIPAGLDLQQLLLTDCRLDNPGILASCRLQDVHVMGSSWSGGWAAAVAAWPNLRRLFWERSTLTRQISERNSTSSGCGNRAHTVTEVDNDELPEAMQTAVDKLHDICSGFKHLQSLSIADLPCRFRPAVLQLLKYLQQIKLHSSLECGDHECQITQVWLQQMLPWADIDMMSNTSG